MNDEFQVAAENLIQRILKRGHDPVWVQMALAAADPEVSAAVSLEFRQNEMLRKSFESTATIFDEVIAEGR